MVRIDRGVLDKIIDSALSELKEYNLIPYPSIITITGSVAAVYNPNLYGVSVFRPEGEIGDIDIVVTTTNIPESPTEARIYGKPIPLTVKTRDGRTIRVATYINSPLEILSIPAAAYSLHPELSYTIRKDNSGELGEFVNLITENLKNHTHPVGTAIQLGVKDKNVLEEIYFTNLSNLKLAIKYTSQNLEEKLAVVGTVPLHDVFKLFGAEAVYILFLESSLTYLKYKSREDSIDILKKEGLHTRYEALKKIAPETYRTFQDFYVNENLRLSENEFFNLKYKFEEEIEPTVKRIDELSEELKYNILSLEN